MELNTCLVSLTRRYSWNANATVIWVDQPVGTGFSYVSMRAACPCVSIRAAGEKKTCLSPAPRYGGLLHNEQQVAADMHAFILAWLARYPQYATLDFHLFGESYAGHYVPAISREIVRQNAAAAAGDATINFIGMAIGNGLTDPATQYKCGDLSCCFYRLPRVYMASPSGQPV